MGAKLALQNKRLLPAVRKIRHGGPHYIPGQAVGPEGSTAVALEIDARTRNLVWRGAMADPIGNPARIGPEFARAAKDILEKFPVVEKN